MASVSALRDNFTDNSIGSPWTTIVSGSATVTETGGQAKCTLPSSTAGTHVGYYRTITTYDLTSDSWYINIGTMVATGVAATMTFDLFLDSINILRWRQLSNTITARHIVAGTETQVYTATWSATTYKYLRIRADTTTVYWDSSTNGTSWTNRASLAISSLFAITDLFIQFGATCGNIASPGSLQLDDVNLILPALTTNWRTQTGIWGLTNRHKRTTLAIDTAGTAQGFLITADGVDSSDAPSGNVKYWSGPASDGRTLTSQPDLASAQAMAVNIPLDGSFDLPTQIDARCFQLNSRSIDGSAFVLEEFFPRRLVQADDIEAESIRALHIVAGEITADKLAASMVISNLISTAYNGARVTLSGAAFGGFIGYGASDTYDPATGTGTYQILWDKADGKFYAGTGNVVIDSNGITIACGTSGYNIVKWTNSGTEEARVYGQYAPSSGAEAHLESVNNVSGEYNKVFVQAVDTSTTVQSLLYLFSQRGSSSLSEARLQINSVAELSATPGQVTVWNGLNVGTATSATTGQVFATVSDAATSTVTDLAIFGHDSSGTPAAGFGGNLRINLETSTTSNTVAAVFQTTWVTATHASRAARLTIHAYDTVAREGVRIEASGSAAKIGFLGAAAVVRQTVAAAAPAGGTGATAGAYDTAAHRDALITLVNDIRTAGINLGLWS